MNQYLRIFNSGTFWQSHPVSFALPQKKVEWKDLNSRSDCVFGMLVHSDGSQYVGSFVKGLPHGRGRFMFQRGGEYEGDFWLGNKHGQGTLRYPDGSVYQGQFHRGLKHGLGAMRFADATT
jgi:hypothetical protein